MASRDASVGINLIGHDKVSAVLDKMGKNAKKTESTMQKVGHGMSKSLKTVAIAGVAAAAAVAKFGFDALKAAEDGKKSEARTLQVAKSMGIFGKHVDQVANRLNNLSDVMARNAGIDDDTIKLTQAKLLTFKELAKTADKVGGAFDRATMAAIDMAAAGFGTADANAVQLGKALNDPIKGITALSRSGITFTAIEKKRIKTLVESNKIGQAQDLVLKAIEKQVGGTAYATASSTDKMKILWGQLEEQVGNVLLPTFEKFTGYLSNTAFPVIAKWGTRVAKVFTDVFSGDFSSAKRLGASLQKQIRNFVGYIGKKLVDYAPVVQAKLRDLISKLGKALPGLVKKMLTDGGKSASSFGAWLTAMAPKALKALSSTMNKLAEYLSVHGAEIVSSIVSWAIKSFPDLIVGLAKFLDVIRKWLLTSGIPAIRSLLLALGKTLILGIFDGIKQARPIIEDKIASIGSSIAKSLTAPFRTAFNKVAEWWNESIGSTTFEIPWWVGGVLAGKSFSFPKMPNIPALADGGIVTRPTLALVGEAGPEAVVPLKNGRAGGAIYINIEGSVIAERDLVYRLRNELGQLMRRQSAGTAAFGI